MGIQELFFSIDKWATRVFELILQLVGCFLWRQVIFNEIDTLSFLNNQCFITLYLHQHIDSVFINFRSHKKDECKHFEKTDSHKVSQLSVKIGKLLNAVIPSLKIVRIYALTTEQDRILANFCSYLERNDDFINSFWNLLTFKKHCTLFIFQQHLS